MAEREYPTQSVNSTTEIVNIVKQEAFIKGGQAVLDNIDWEDEKLLEILSNWANRTNFDTEYWKQQLLQSIKLKTNI